MGERERDFRHPRREPSVSSLANGDRHAEESSRALAEAVCTAALLSAPLFAFIGEDPFERSRERLFAEFLAQSSGPCLQIAVKTEIGRKFGDNWISVDRYDHSAVIDRHDDIHALDFADNHFNSVVCWSVLEHVPEPQRAIAEMRRVLKPGGTIWVQLPFLFPYHADPHDYWRVTPSGLRQWMRDFEAGKRSGRTPLLRSPCRRVAVVVEAGCP